MKKLLYALLLLLFVAAFTGCAQNESEIWPGTSYYEDMSLEIIDGKVTDPHGWNWFVSMPYGQILGTGETVLLAKSIRLSYVDGEDRISAELYRENDGFLLKNGEDTRSYSCVTTQLLSGPDAVREIFILSNEPDMTAERFAGGENTDALQAGSFSDYADAFLVYLDTIPLQRAVCYGEVPEKYAGIAACASTPTCFGEQYIYQIQALQAAGQEHDALNRYDLAGNLLCTVPSGNYVNTGINVCDLPDGAFVQEFDPNNGQNNSLICYEADGSVRWEFVFPYADYFGCANSIVRHNDGIYTFGEIRNPDHTGESVCSDIMVCKFSPEGELLRQRVFTGSDFENLYRVELTEEGFLMYGSTQSCDGDFPFSEGGYGKEFVARLDFDLQFLDCCPQEYDASFLDAGFRDGAPVYDDDPVFTPKGADILPQCYNGAVFYTVDGYIIVRRHGMGLWKLNPPVRNAQGSYTEWIITGYSHEGEPLWQTVSDVYVT